MFLPRQHQAADNSAALSGSVALVEESICYHVREILRRAPREFTSVHGAARESHNDTLFRLIRRKGHFIAGRSTFLSGPVACTRCPFELEAVCRLTYEQTASLRGAFSDGIPDR